MGFKQKGRSNNKGWWSKRRILNKRCVECDEKEGSTGRRRVQKKGGWSSTKKKNEGEGKGLRKLGGRRSKGRGSKKEERGQKGSEEAKNIHRMVRDIEVSKRPTVVRSSEIRITTAPFLFFLSKVSPDRVPVQSTSKFSWSESLLRNNFVSSACAREEAPHTLARTRKCFELFRFRALDLTGFSQLST